MPVETSWRPGVHLLRMLALVAQQFLHKAGVRIHLFIYASAFESDPLISNRLGMYHTNLWLSQRLYHIHVYMHDDIYFFTTNIRRKYTA